MFVESYLTPAVSDYLQKYFVNFDRQNFSLSWTGNATLSNLILRPDALEKQFPIRILGGKVGSLYISVSVGLTSAPKIELALQDVFILAAPPTEFAYDKAQAQLTALQSKRDELVALEKKRNQGPQEPEPEGDTGFFQQLLASALTNITLTLENIHIRFEDNRIAPPLAVGVTLRSFTVHSTSSDWVPSDTQVGAKTGFKLLNLDGLGVYMNAGERNPISPNVNDRSPEALNHILAALQNLQQNPAGRLTYVLQPLSSTIKATITLRPEKLDEPFSLPRADLEIDMPELGIDINNEQFHVALRVGDLLESMERSKRYLQFRPNRVPHGKGYGKWWWLFALQGVLIDVRRRKQNWSWRHMKYHRDLSRQYAKAYAQQISQTGQSEQDRANIQQLEDKLDNFNIILIRKQQDILNNRKIQKVAEKSKSLWWGKATLTKEELDEVLNGKFSDEEKAKLYQTMDYEPSEKTLVYPPDYAGTNVTFSLPNLKIGVSNIDGTVATKCLDFSIRGSYLGYQNFPGSKGYQVKYALDDIEVNGIEVKSSDPNDQAPSILMPFNDLVEGQSLVSFEFEKHLYDNGRATKRIKLNAEQLSFIYDAKSMQAVVDCFTWPPDIQMSKASAKTQSKILNFGRTCLNSVMQLAEVSEEVELDMNFTAPYVLFPEGGTISGSNYKLIFNMGTWIAQGVPRQGAAVDQAALAAIAGDSEEISPEASKLAYNQYQLQLKNFEILLAQPGKLLFADPSLDASVQPLSLFKASEAKVDLNQCILHDDPRFPAVRLDFSLPSIDFDVSDNSICKFFSILVEFPFAKRAPKTKKIVDLMEDPSVNYHAEVEELVSTPETRISLKSRIGASKAAVAQLIRQSANEPDFDPEKAKQFTYFFVTLAVKQYNMKLSKLRDEQTCDYIPLIDMTLKDYYATYKSQTFGNTFTTRMGEVTAIYLESHLNRDEPLYLFKTSAQAELTGSSDIVWSLRVFRASSDCPSNTGVVKNRAQGVISSVDMVLFEETLLICLDIINQIIQILTSVSEVDKETQGRIALEIKQQKDADEAEQERANLNDVDIKLEANLSRFTILFANQDRSLLKVSLDDLVAKIEDGPLQTKGLLQIAELQVENLDTPTFYPLVLTQLNKEKFLDASISIFKGVHRGELEADQEIKLSLAPHKVVVLGTTVDNLLQFVNKFQVAKAALIRLAKVAVSKTANLVKSAYARDDTKMALDIVIHAPIFYHPRDTQSPDVIIFRLGVIEIHNSLSARETGLGRNAIMDNIEASLVGLQMNNSYIDAKTHDIISEVKISDPITFTGKITRNLSCGWYPEIPQVKCSITSSPVQIDVSADDFILASTNLTGLISAIRGNQLPWVYTDEEATNVTGSTQISGTTSDAPKPYLCLIMADFVCPSMAVKLFTSTPKLQQRTGLIDRGDDFRFAYSTADTVSVSAAYWNNGDYKLQSYMNDATLEDSRPGIQDVTKFVERKHTAATGDIEKIFKIELERRELQSTALSYKYNFAMAELEMTINMSFLSALLKMAKDVAESVPRPKKSIHPPKDKGVGTTSVTVGATELERPSPILDISIQLPGFTLIILEDSSSQETNALMTRIDGYMEVKSNGFDESHGEGELHLSSNTAQVVPGRPVAPKAEIFSMATFKMGVETNAMEGVVLRLHVSPFAVRVSSGTILIISKISTAIQSLPKPGEGEFMEEPEYEEAWESVENKYRAYWFLRSRDVRSDVENVVTKTEIVDVAWQYREAKVVQRLIVSDVQIDFSFEVGTGVISTPLGLVNLNGEFEIVNWTRNLLVNGDIRMSASYNNTYYGVWEYLLEPVEIPKPFGNPDHRWWQIHFTVSKPEGTPNLKIEMTSTDVAELTVSKTAVAIIQKIVQSYATAAFEDVSEKDVKSPPYIFKNDTGFDLTIDIANTPLIAILDDGSSATTLQLSTGAEVDLGLKPQVGSAEGKAQVQRTVRVSIPRFGFNESIVIANAKPRFYELNQTSYDGQKYGLLFDIVTNSAASTYVTARSIVEVNNELRVPVDVFNVAGGNSHRVTTMQPHSRWALPLDIVHEQSDGLCFKAEGYLMGPVPFGWQNMRGTPGCTWVTVAGPESGNGDNANIKIIGKSLPAVMGNTDTATSVGQNYKIFLKGHLLINNLLPIALVFESDGHTVHNIQPGQSENIFCVTPQKKMNYSFNVWILDYRGQNWFSRIDVVEDDEQLVPIVFKSQDNRQTVCFGYKKGLEDDLVTISVYCPYWMVNHTGLNLRYKSSAAPDVTEHPADSAGLLMFAYNQTLGKEKTLVQCEDSEWSDEINLDAAGLPGGIICQGPTQSYNLTADIALSKCGMSKIVTFTPRTTLVNTGPYDLVFNEVDRPDEEIDVPKHTSVPLYQRGTVGKFNVKVKDTDESSVDIYFDRANDTFAKLENKYGGIHVVVHASETKVTVTFTEFMPGEVPLLIVNDAPDIKITYFQHDTEEEPGFLDIEESVNYTWYDPTSEDRTLDWAPSGYKENTRCSLSLDKDDKGYFTAYNKNTYHWISLRSGVQRILLVTKNSDLVDSLGKMSSTENEVPLLEFILNWKGLGISLINNEAGKEILYLRADSTDPIWEGSPEGVEHFKILDAEQNLFLEHGYQNYIAGVLRERPAVLEGGIKVDFANFKMYEPDEQQLSRNPAKSGFAFKFNKYSNAMDVDVKFGTMQIDNQLPTTVYPRMFLAAPIQKSVSTKTEVPPHIMMLKLSKRTTPASNVHFISGTFILQEFNIATDMSIVSSVLDILTSSDSQEVAEKLSKQYKTDLVMASRTKEQYNEDVVLESTAGRTIYVFENLELYKLRFNVTFAMTGSDGAATYNPFLYLTQGIGAVMGNLTEKPFDVAGLTIKNTRMTMSQLVKEIISTYSFGVVKNLYSVVFELDVIGNPFKLITGIGSGIGSLITEPFAGALQGNLLEGVSIGVGSLVDNTLGNVAGSISAITGSFAKGADAIGLHILGGAVSGISGLFGGIKKVTHGTLKTASAVRPRRLFKPNSYLEPYSLTMARGYSLFGAVLASYPDAGPFDSHVFISHEKALLFTSKMAFFIEVLSDDVSKLSSVLWGHKWDEFADISPAGLGFVDFNLKDAGGWFIARNNPHLKVGIDDPEILKYVLQKANQMFQNATRQ